MGLRSDRWLLPKDHHPGGCTPISVPGFYIGGEIDSRAPTEQNPGGPIFPAGHARTGTRIIGDKEPFGYDLSAFLNAAMSVRERFQIRQDRPRNAAVKAWRAQWESSLSPDEKVLYSFMHKDMVDEVRYSGSSREAGQEGVPLPIGTHYLDGSMVMISGPPGMEPAVAKRPTYSFTISASERMATQFHHRLQHALWP